MVGACRDILIGLLITEARSIMLTECRVRAMLGFERWQSANKRLPLGVCLIPNLGSIDGVEASRMKVVFDRISPSGFGAASWSLPTMDVRVEVKDTSYREGGWHSVEMSEPAQAALS